MKHRFVVLGGAGFLGAHVARWLVGRGHAVRLFDLRTPARHPVDPGPGVEYLEGNFLNPSDVRTALHGGADAVLHFISTTVPASSMNDVPVEIETNVAATVRLLDLMLEAGIRRIGFPSSGGTVYASSSLPHREDEAVQPTCPYGLGKVLIEEVLAYYARHRGLEYQVWRIANPYGDPAKLHTAQGVIDAFLHRVRNGQPLTVWGDGAAMRDFLFADDVAAAIGALLERGPWSETVNVGSSVGHSIGQVLAAIERVVDRPLSIERREGYTGPPCSVLDSTKLRRLTGWAPGYDLATGIAEAWRRGAPSVADPVR